MAKAILEIIPQIAPILKKDLEGSFFSIGIFMNTSLFLRKKEDILCSIVQSQPLPVYRRQYYCRYV